MIQDSVVAMLLITGYLAFVVGMLELRSFIIMYHYDHAKKEGVPRTRLERFFDKLLRVK